MPTPTTPIPATAIKMFGFESPADFVSASWSCPAIEVVVPGGRSGASVADT